MSTFGVPNELLEKLGIDFKAIKSRDELCLAIYQLSKQNGFCDDKDVLSVMGVLLNSSTEACHSSELSIPKDIHPSEKLEDCKRYNESGLVDNNPPCTPNLSVAHSNERTPLLSKRSYIDEDAIFIEYPTCNLYPDLPVNCTDSTSEEVKKGTISEVVTPIWKKISLIKKIPSIVTRTGMGLILSIVIVLMIPVIIHGVGFGQDGINAGSLAAYMESYGRKGMPQFLKAVIGVLIYFIFLYKTRTRKDSSSSKSTVSIQTEDTGILEV